MLKLIHSFNMKYLNVLDYYNSFEINGFKDINCYAIRLAGYSEEKYFEWIKNHERGMYYLVDSSNENYIIGFGSIEDIYFRYIGDIGNIGYGIRPLERNKGYGYKLLKLLLNKCEEYGMNKVYISCEKGNIPSQKIIEKSGGVLEKEFYDDLEGYGIKYWIKLKPKFKNKVKWLIKTL